MAGKGVSTRKITATKPMNEKITSHLRKRSPTGKESSVDGNMNQYDASKDGPSPYPPGVQEGILKGIHNLSAEVKELTKDNSTIKNALEGFQTFKKDITCEMLTLETENETLKDRLLKLERSDEV